MQKIVTDKLAVIKELCAAHNVKALYAFGSVCTDRFTDASDIDLLISFKAMDFGEYSDAYFELADKLEEIFHRHVDLITDKSLSNPYFINTMNKTRTLLYG